MSVETSGQPRRAARRWPGLALRFAAALIGVAALLGAGLFAALSVRDSPAFALRVLGNADSDIGDWRIFPARAIARADAPSDLPGGTAFEPAVLTYPYDGASRTETLAGLLERSGTRAFIVVQDDQLVLEHYAPGFGRDDVNTSFSAAKSFDSALIGAAIADGLIGSVADPVIKYVPEITGRGLDALTIRDLLAMNTGIRYVHNDEMPFYMAPFGDDAITYYGTELRKLALSVQLGPTPVGAAFRYNNYHPLLEGLILERVTGMPVAKYLEQRIWQPMGAAFDASWSLDSDASGFEKMESGLNARALDFARFGLLFLHRGMWNGRQILPASWVDDSTSPLPSDARPWEVYPNWPKLGGYYAYHWWGLVNSDGSHDFMARGKFDQLIYVSPRKNVVVVRLGDAPDDRLNWPLAIRALLDQLPPTAQ